jgi:sporulation protein YlmC with PRC-barrel domain
MSANIVPAEALLGRRVVDAHGSTVGVVLDVGIGEQRAPKFLLVGPSPQLLRRVEMRDVAEAASGALRLRAS